MELPDQRWVTMAQISKRGDQSVYTLVNTGGIAPTIDVSNDGGATFVTLTEASLADTAVDLILSRDAAIRATTNGATVNIT